MTAARTTTARTATAKPGQLDLPHVPGVTTPHAERFAHIRLVGGTRYAEFLAAGYRESYTPSKLHGTPWLLQKCMRGAGGEKLFYISIEVWDWSEYVAAHPHIILCSMSPSVQFNGHGRSEDDRGGDEAVRPTFNVDLLSNRLGPAEIEGFYLRVYHAMGCRPYGE